MPKKFPAEFQRDVVTVAHRGGASRAEIAVDNRRRRLSKLTPIEFELAVHNRQPEAA